MVGTVESPWMSNGHSIAGQLAGYDCGVDCLGKNGIDNSGGYDRW